MSEVEEDGGGYESAHSGRSSTGSQSMPPRKVDYLWLGEDHCRAHMSTKISGTTVPVLCPRLVDKCGYHERARKDGHIGNPGAYLRVTSPSSRSVYGSRDDEPLTRAAYDALADVDGLNFEEVAETLNQREIPVRLDNSEGNNSAGTPQENAPDSASVTSAPARMEIQAGVIGTGNRSRIQRTRDEEHSSHVSEALPGEESDLNGLSTPRVSTPGSPTRGSSRQPEPISALRGGRNKQADGAPTEPPQWYGLTNPMGSRFITKSLDEMRSWVVAGLTVIMMWSTELEARNWKAEGDAISVADDESLGRETTPVSGSSTIPASRRPHKEKAKSRRSKKVRKRSRRRHRKKRSSDYSSDEYASSSSSSENDSSSGSDSDGSDSTRESGRSRRAKGSKRLSKKKHLKLSIKMAGTDKSEGHEGKIHGHASTDTKLVLAAAPEGLNLKEADKFFEYAVDVASLPGMYHAADLDNMKGVEQVLALQYAGRSGGTAKRDALWQTKSRNALSSVKSKESLLRHVEEVTKIEKAAFQRQRDLIDHLMREHRYSTTEIDLYVHGGGLPNLVQQTYRRYVEFLHMMQNLAINSNSDWESSQAGCLLRYHSEKLLGVRRAAYDRKRLILGTYVYLRDAKAKGFTDTVVYNGLWKQLDSGISHVPSPSQESLNESGDRRESPSCGHCRLPALHVHLRKGSGKSNCPFKDQTSANARKAAKPLLTLKLEHPDKALSDLVKQALEGG